MALDGLAPERDIIVRQTAWEGARVVVVTFQPEPGKRMRRLAKMTTSDPLDSYTEHGIARLLPAATNASLKSTAALKAGDWERFYNETRRVRAEAFVKQIKPMTSENEMVLATLWVVRGALLVAVVALFTAMVRAVHGNRMGTGSC